MYMWLPNQRLWLGWISSLSLTNSYLWKQLSLVATSSSNLAVGCILLGDSPVDYVEWIARFTGLWLLPSVLTCFRDSALWTRSGLNEIMRRPATGCWEKTTSPKAAVNGDSVAVNRPRNHQQQSSGLSRKSKIFLNMSFKLWVQTYT